MTERVVRRLRIAGRVQGVWFRDSMQREANRAGVAGWVRNRGDGTVEAVVAGTQGAVDAMVAWSRRGPEKAEVTRVDGADDFGEFAAFEVLPDA
jgi:acylphosphatase